MRKINGIFTAIAAAAAALLLLAACSEPFDLKTKTTDTTYLCVEALLTDMTAIQIVRLSESMDYDGTGTAPAVSGASVKVSDGDNTFLFTENPDDKGNYLPPAGFKTKIGKTYSLDINCTLSDGTVGSYSAVSEMPDNGFDIEKIDFKYLGAVMDSTWTIGVWGKDRPTTNYFLISTAVNGVMAPATSILDRAMLMPDTYFNASSVAGFPIAFLYQNARQQEKYGACAKYLEKGDIVSLVVYTMTEDFFNFIMAMSSASSAISIPVISAPPANVQTNIEGGPAMGWFATCPVAISSTFVDDPLRSDFRK